VPPPSSASIAALTRGSALSARHRCAACRLNGPRNAPGRFKARRSSSLNRRVASDVRATSRFKVARLASGEVATVTKSSYSKFLRWVVPVWLAALRRGCRVSLSAAPPVLLSRADASTEGVLASAEQPVFHAIHTDTTWRSPILPRHIHHERGAQVFCLLEQPFARFVGGEFDAALSRGDSRSRRFEPELHSRAQRSHVLNDAHPVNENQCQNGRAVGGSFANELPQRSSFLLRG
jgi:hypothetical protein